MARNNDENSFNRRRREREQKESRELSIPEASSDSNLDLNDLSDIPDHFLHLLQQAESLIDQINNLYQMYAVGVERLPPLEKEKVLDRTFLNAQSMPKPTPATRFRFSSLQGRYTSFKERWAKLIKDIDSGKIKRVTGPKKR